MWMVVQRQIGHRHREEGKAKENLRKPSLTHLDSGREWGKAQENLKKKLT